jgi:hypothetical protein
MAIAHHAKYHFLATSSLSPPRCVSINYLCSSTPRISAPFHLRCSFRPDSEICSPLLHHLCRSSSSPSPSSLYSYRSVAAYECFHREQARRTRLHRGFDSEHILSFYICRSFGAGFSNSVSPSSTDARCSLSTQLFSPPATSQLTVGVFFTGSILVVSMWFRSKNLFVIWTSLTVRFVIKMFNM